MLFRLFPDHIDILVMLIPTLMFALCFHEFSHAYVAYVLGDDTAQREGRLTLNPLAHLDFVGSLMILFVGFGWAKPVPVNPTKLNNAELGMMKVAIAGPASNLFLALLAGILIRLISYYELHISQMYIQIILYFLHINIALAVFNLIPVSPLDGSQIFNSVVGRQYPDLVWKLQVNGPKILFGVIIFGIISGIPIIGTIMTPFIKFFMFLFAGI